jgi:N-acetyl-anhydromuramyl-L-alanine amidase AmpD
MAHFLCALLLLLPMLANAAEAPVELQAARLQSQYLIDEAYLLHPVIPAGLLESQAWAATRWQHRVPEQATSPAGMPAVFGIFGFYSTNEYGFVDLLGEVAVFNGRSKAELMGSEKTYIDATAAYLEEQIVRNGLAGQSIEKFRPIVELLSGIDPASEAARFAVNSHVNEFYVTAGHGVDKGGVVIRPQLVDLRKVFTEEELGQVGAETLVIDVAGDNVEQPQSKKKSAFSAAGSSAVPSQNGPQVNVDYPGATWKEAANWSSRDATAISHVVIHTMEGSYAGSINWFLNPDSQVSSHYLMRSSDGQVTQMVRDAKKAWHARSANVYTLGIEHEGFVDNPDWYTGVMYDESAKLTAYMCNAYQIDCSKAYNGVSHAGLVELSNEFTVKGHQHYPEQVHSDPGINWDWPRYYALLNGGVTPPDVNVLPEATFVIECTALVCNFDATNSSDADGAIVSYDWDYGDGTTGTASTASHAYQTAADYIVQLSVTDDKGAVHQTSGVAVAQNAPPPPPPKPTSSGGGSVSVWMLLALLLCRPVFAQASTAERGDTLQLPAIHAAGYHTIAGRIFANETRGQTRYLTYWGAGEDFPSLGIGHFIWFPDGVDAPFDESFPTMVNYVRQHADSCSSMPAWLSGLQPFAAPWQSKQEFDAEQQSERMLELRQWLIDTAPQQARYIVASFSARWNELPLPAEQKLALTQLLQGLVRTPQGLFAVVDYYNFKGLGSNPRERYHGEGWGLVQVLGDISKQPNSADASDLLQRFSVAAAERLAMRVRNAPPERNEARWLEGWHVRVADYSKNEEFAQTSESHFRVTPYLQNPSATGMTIVWFSDTETPGLVTVRSGEAESDVRRFASKPTQACELAYHLAEYGDLEAAQSLPFRHVLQLEGLTPGYDYDYDVVQDGELASGAFSTPAPQDTAIRFVVYGDSETEPESSGKHALWSVPGDSAAARKYLVDQTAGYAANLDVIARAQPDFIAIAGDLVESGGEQRDWDEFWSHNARLGATTPIIPAAGNHDYYGGPGDLGGYSDNASRRAIGKFQTYFPAGTRRVLDFGPAVLIVLDANSGNPERSARDTNWYLRGEHAGGPAPEWVSGSEQAAWLEQTLEHAQRNKQFTFVMFHHAPYSSGIHGRPPGVGAGENFASGMPLQSLTPMLLRYGVTAVFSGHDEIYEHSTVTGGRGDHTVHFFTVGIGGDGLRGPESDVENLQRVFLAHDDAPEKFDDNGILLEGGKHYGHLEVNLTADDSGNWQARIEPVYVFPLMSEDGKVQSFERRIYDDVTVIEGANEH